MKKKNGKGNKRKIAGIICLVLVVLFAGTLVSAYSIFKVRFYDRSNYVKRGTYMASRLTERKGVEGEKNRSEAATQAVSAKTDVSEATATDKNSISVNSATKNADVDSAEKTDIFDTATLTIHQRHQVETGIPETESERKTLAARSGSTVQKTTESEKSNMLVKMAQQFFSKKDTYNILLLGVDRRDESWEGNSDVILLVTVNKEKKTVYLTSFLRDLYADIPGVGVRKLNAACANGGPELTVQTLEDNYQVEIDNYAMVDFNAMIDVVDALGGVDLEIDEDERVTANDYITCMCEDNGDDPEDYYIEKAGLVHLNGYQAVGYARNRYTGKGSDFGRTQRQRNVLTAIAEKAQDGDYASLSDTMEDVMPYITHDITEMQMIGLMMQLGSWLDYDIQQQHIPYDGEYTSQDEILVPTDMNATVEKLTSILYGDGEIETETESESETETEAVQ
ncbi:LCP family protein [Jingyaoa shaoxingensis]|uniref:LCP family protein n=1 Tax=Jingyaoa shaoxingensis TaxID=2763671 RepID=A0ABR7NBL2_9FIRM|nr:LCP family protein [Jingyaoa shaoxingensis]MBC8573118.1 LCP family protein [Jingyaoa shaoxingensis]